MGQCDVVDAATDIVHSPWVTAIPVGQHFFDHLTLKVVLRATKITGDDGKLPKISPPLNQGFAAIIKGPDQNILPVITTQLGRHGLQLGTVKHIQHQRFDHIVWVVAQGDFVAPIFFAWL